MSSSDRASFSNADAPADRAVLAARVRDIFVMMGDRRHELDGEKWRALAQPGFQPHGDSQGEDADVRFSRRMTIEGVESKPCVRLAPRLSPQRLDAYAAGQAGSLSIADKVSQILRYTLLPLRWEPQNHAGEHRGVASAGGLFATETYLTARYRGQDRVFHVDPSDMSLTVTEAADAATILTEGKTRIVTIARPSRLAREYGEFGAGLAVIEGAMIQAQLALLGQFLGLNPRCLDGMDDMEWVETVLCRHWSDVPLAALELDLGSAVWLDELPLSSITVPVEDEDFGPAERSTALRTLVTALKLPCPPGRSSLQHDTNPAPSFPLFSSVVRRTSGHGLGMGPAAIASLADDVRAIVAAASGAMRSIGVCPPVMSAVLRSDVDQRMAFSHIDPTTGMMSPTRLGDCGDRYARGLCSGSVFAVMTIGADGLTLTQAMEDGWLRDIYRMVGEATQCLCLAAADAGYFARPSRAEPDKMMNLFLAPDDIGLIQVMIGKDQHAGLAFPLQ